MDLISSLTVPYTPLWCTFIFVILTYDQSLLLTDCLRGDYEKLVSIFGEGKFEMFIKVEFNCLHVIINDALGLLLLPLFGSLSVKQLLGNYVEGRVMPVHVASS